MFYCRRATGNFDDDIDAAHANSGRCREPAFAAFFIFASSRLCRHGTYFPDYAEMRDITLTLRLVAIMPA